MKSTPEKFSKTQIYLHWLIAALIAFQFLFHDEISLIWYERMQGKIPNVASLNLHALIGFIILILVLWRLWLRFKLGVPALPESKSKIAGLIAKATHYLFYILLVTMSFSGAAAWFLGIKQPAFVHVLSGNILIAIIALHIAAALAHHFILKTNVLKRIIGMN